MKHKHHIIPKHMGGNDEPENLIELTVVEHAEAHRILYEQHGLWQDYLAWKGLLKLMTTEECRLLAIRGGGKEGARIANMKRWGSHIKFKDDPDYLPFHKRSSGYAKNVDGRKVRSKRYWFNDGVTEGQYSLDGQPEGWSRGRLRSVMRKTNPYVSL